MDLIPTPIKTYTRRVSCDLGSLTKLASGEQLLELLHIKVICTWQVGTTCELEGKFCVVEGAQDVWDNRLLIYTDREHLTLPVYPNNAVRSFVLCGDEYGLPGDTVHVYASTRLEIIQVDKTELGDQEYDSVLLRHLDGHGEVVRCFGREVNVNSLLDEGRIGCGVINLYHMKLNHRSEKPNALDAARAPLRR